jgi:AraC-like DNA-binding protein
MARDCQNVLAGWQIKLSPVEDEGKRILAAMAKHFHGVGFIFEADDLQLKASECLVSIADGRYPAALAGPMANGVARILVGSLVGAAIEHLKADLTFDEEAPDSSKNLADRVREYIEANLSHSIFLDDIASHFHYSARHLNRVFDRHFRVSIGQYTRERRFELAERWLVTTNRSIKDIGLSLGYDNISYFSRYFKLKTGFSPTDYRVAGRMKTEQNTFSDAKRR